MARFSPLPLPLHRRYWTAVLISRASKTSTATFKNTFPSAHPPKHCHRRHLSDPSSSSNLSSSKTLPPLLYLLSLVLCSHLSVLAYQTEPMLNDSVRAKGHGGGASWCLDLGKRVLHEMCSDGKWLMLPAYHRANFHVPVLFCCITPHITATGNVENLLWKKKQLWWR